MIRAQETAFYGLSGSVRYSFGGEGGTEDEDRDETAEAAGVVGVGAVADSIVVVGGEAAEDVVEVGRPNIFDRRLARIPIAETPYARSLAVANGFSPFWMPGNEFLHV